MPLISAAIITYNRARFLDDAISSVLEPPKQLKGYQRVFRRPGRSVMLALALTSRSFAQWSSASKSWTVTPGLYRLLVGASSRDIRLRGFIRQP